MQRTVLTIRIFFLMLCITSSYLVCLSVKEWDQYLLQTMVIGTLIGLLVILVDILLKGFSLRGLSALTFGMFVGWLMAYFISNSPLFESGDPKILYLSKLALFLIMMYLGSVVALRGRDEFNLVIPYVRFVPHGVEVPLVVVDTSALIDGRVYGICANKFMGYALVIPRFVLDELQRIADSPDTQRQIKGRKGLDVLNKLKALDYLDLRVHESDITKRQNVDAKLVFLAQTLKARLLTTDYNLARMAEFHNVEWLNLSALAKVLNPELNVGITLEVDLIKAGKESGQALGFLNDGSMVVVNDGSDMIGQKVVVEVQSILPSAGGKMVFANVLETLED